MAAFIRASNATYEIDEGRPLWKILPVRLRLTVAVVTLQAVSAVSVVATGVVAERAGQFLGIGSTAVTVWDIAKWPVIAVLVSLAFALLLLGRPRTCACQASAG